MKYRPEIDGLRALAVIPVILFHAGFKLFSGGFIGVDIFFVISGYLITSILINDLEKEQFSLGKFYERRARRILPALFLVMAASIPFALLWMTPSQMKDFAQSFVAVSLFSSNLLFGAESGYFSLTSDTKPFLHTWSLAVEEQYYLFFPIFIYFAWRLGKERVFWIIVSFFSLSLFVSEWGWRNIPTWNFYLAPTRAWELLAGSIAAFIIQKHGIRSSNTFSALGILSILIPMFAFNQTTPSPSLFMAIPVLGTVLLILFAGSQTFVAKSLGAKVPVAIGLISYSAYLWHQPLFAFARIWKMKELDFVFALVLVVASFLLAAYSWKYVEQPFRKSNSIAKPWTLGFASLIIWSSCLSFGLYGHISDGFIRSAEMSTKYAGDVSNDNFFSFVRKEFIESQDPFICKNSERFRDVVRSRQSRNGKLDIVIVGDSHAEHIFPGFAKALPEKNVGCFIQNESPSLNNLYFKHVCENIIVPNDIKNVIISVSKNRLNESSIKNLASYITSLGERTIYLVRDNPSFLLDPAYLKYRKLDLPPTAFNISADVATAQLEKLDAVYNEFSENFAVKIIDPYQSLENSGVFKMHIKNELLFRDTHHLNIPGSLRFGKILSSKILK